MNKDVKDTNNTVEEVQWLKPIVIPVEVITFFHLTKNNPLLLLYTQLVSLHQFGLLKGFKEKELARMLKISPEHFSKRCKELESLKLVAKTKKGVIVTIELTVPQTLIFSKELRKLLTVKKNIYYGIEEKELDLLAKNLLNDIQKSTTKPLSLSSIYSNNYSKLNTVYSDNRGERIIKRFPSADYQKVIDACAKLTKVERKGPELSKLKPPIRNMFLSGRTPEQIIRFMGWLRDHRNDPQFKWLRFWTMSTVERWLPDFLAGRLDSDDDDRYQQL